MNFRVLTFLILACLFPSSAFAFWGNKVDICDAHTLAEPVSRSPEVSPCAETDDNSEENNVCLEAAAFPISTTKSLLKMMGSWHSDQSKGEDVLKQIAEVAISVAGGSSDMVEQVSTPVKQPTPARSCLASNLADCEFTPATPTIQLASTAVYGRTDTSQLYTTTSIELNNRLTHQYRYQFSHKDWNHHPPVPPPRTA